MIAASSCPRFKSVDHNHYDNDNVVKSRSKHNSPVKDGKNAGSGYYYTLIAFSPYEKWPEKDDQAPIYHQSHSLLTNNGGGMFF